MPDPITRIIVRRGLESERFSATLLVGEPGYAIDSKRLYIGDGTTLGGNPIGMRNIGFANFNITGNLTNISPSLAPAIGDIVYDNTTGLLYTLVTPNYDNVDAWAPFGANLAGDNINIYIEDDVIKLKRTSLDFSYFLSSAVGRGLEVINGSTIQIATPSSELIFTGNTLSIATGSVSNTLLSNMPPNTVKARRVSVGSPEDLSFDTFANILAPLILQYAPAVAIVPTGTILDFAGENPPNGYLLCDGSAVSRSTYLSLFETIGTTWGSGDGSTTFNLPDLRGRTTIGAGQGGGLSERTLGQRTIGAESVLLTANESGLRAHVHVVPRDARTPGSIDSTGAGSESGGSSSSAFNFNTLANNAENAITPHTNMQPSAVTNKIIKF